MQVLFLFTLMKHILIIIINQPFMYETEALHNRYANLNCTCFQLGIYRAYRIKYVEYATTLTSLKEEFASML